MNPIIEILEQKNIGPDIAKLIFKYKTQLENRLLNSCIKKIETGIINIRIEIETETCIHSVNYKLTNDDFQNLFIKTIPLIPFDKIQDEVELSINSTTGDSAVFKGDPREQIYRCVVDKFEYNLDYRISCCIHHYLLNTFSKCGYKGNRIMTYWKHAGDFLNEFLLEDVYVSD